MNNIKKVKIIAYAKKLHISEKLFKTDFVLFSMIQKKILLLTSESFF